MPATFCLPPRLAAHHQSNKTNKKDAHSLFSQIPIFDLSFEAKAHKPFVKALFGSVYIRGIPPKTSPLGLFVAMLGCLISCEWAFVSTLFSSSHALLVFSVIEILLLVSLYLCLKISISERVCSIVIYSSITCILSIIIIIFFSHTSGPGSRIPGYWGSCMLWFLGGILFYRFPLRWCGPFILINLIVIAMINVVDQLVFLDRVNSSNLAISCLLMLVGTTFLSLVGWFNRNRALLLISLQEVQTRLRQEILHTEELAARQERTRIARDIHDILTHSLTILSVQVQAMRQLVHKNPESLATKLNEIASLLRESIAESREVVNLLRDPPSEISSENICTHLQEIIERFSQYTGIHCIFTEIGTQQEASTAQDTTLRYALQEALTNAHRHGAAHTIWIHLLWQKDQVALSIRDDGQGAKSYVEQMEKDSGHYGLQGMRERTQALGGELRIGAPETDGFMIELILPHPPVPAQDLPL